MSNGVIRTNSETVLKQFEENGTLVTLRSERFQKLRKCPVCHTGPITPFYLPEEGDKYTCVFCDHPSDIIVLIWVDDYKRIGGERRGIIGSSLCNNCLEYYLDDEGHLILSDLISDAEFKSEECNKDVCLVGDPVPSRNESLYLTHDDNKVCMFCDCPADIIVFSWGDKSNDMLRSAICKNCLENYLDNNKHLILHALVLDTGYA